MEKSTNWRRFGLPAVLALAALAVLAYELTAWYPHSEAGILSGIVSFAVGACMLITAVRRWEQKDWPGFAAAIVLLALMCAVLWASFSIPFCPECDGGVDSALMRWLLAGRL